MVVSTAIPGVAKGPDSSAGAHAAVRLTIVDRDSGLRTVLERRLADTGWRYTFLSQPPSAGELVMMRPHAVVLDLDLAGPARWSYLGRLVSGLPGLPVILCTGPWPVSDRVRALRAGAHDWIGKPCHPDELLARVEAAVRSRSDERPSSGPQVVRAGELELHLHRYAAIVADRDLELTRREFELLSLLVQADGHVLEREAIYRRIWRYEMAHGDRSVDVYVRKLRQKLDSASPRWQYIHTHFGIGYRFTAEPADPQRAPRAGMTDAGRSGRTPRARSESEAATLL